MAVEILKHKFKAKVNSEGVPPDTVYQEFFSGAIPGVNEIVSRDPKFIKKVEDGEEYEIIIRKAVKHRPKKAAKKAAKTTAKTAAKTETKVETKAEESK